MTLGTGATERQRLGGNTDGPHRTNRIQQRPAHSKLICKKLSLRFTKYGGSGGATLNPTPIYSSEARFLIHTKLHRNIWACVKQKKLCVCTLKLAFRVLDFRLQGCADHETEKKKNAGAGTQHSRQHKYLQQTARPSRVTPAQQTTHVQRATTSAYSCANFYRSRSTRDGKFSTAPHLLGSRHLGHRLPSDHFDRVLYRAISGRRGRVRHGVCVCREL